MVNGSVFLKIVCPRCKKKHVTFGRASVRLKCGQCGYLLTQTRGGKIRVRAPVKEVLWN